jgi:hypothetical protein
MKVCLAGRQTGSVQWRAARGELGRVNAGADHSVAKSDGASSPAAAAATAVPPSSVPERGAVAKTNKSTGPPAASTPAGYGIAPVQASSAATAAEQRGPLPALETPLRQGEPPPPKVTPAAPKKAAGSSGEAGPVSGCQGSRGEAGTPDGIAATSSMEKLTLSPNILPV